MGLVTLMQKAFVRFPKTMTALISAAAITSYVQYDNVQEKLKQNETIQQIEREYRDSFTDWLAYLPGAPGRITAYTYDTFVGYGHSDRPRGR